MSKNELTSEQRIVIRELIDSIGYLLTVYAHHENESLLRALRAAAAAETLIFGRSERAMCPRCFTMHRVTRHGFIRAHMAQGGAEYHSMVRP